MRIVLFFILIFILSANKQVYSFENYYPYANSSEYSYPGNTNSRLFDIETLNYLENSLYGRCFPYNTTASRLNKLEKTIFGTNTNGTNSMRLKRLSDAYKNYKQNNFGQNNKYSRRENLKKLARVLFGGVPTGYTPPIGANYGNNTANIPYSVNPSGYGYEQIECDMFGNCRPHFDDINTNMGVKIIRD